MLDHLTSTMQAPARVVVIGAGGFIGGAVADRLEGQGVPTVRLTRAQVDLLASDAADRLAGLLCPMDAVVVSAAVAPCKSAEMLRDNIVLALAVVRGLARVPLAHVVTISSDAVFADGSVPLTETSPMAPDTYHGAMHLAREIMMRAEVAAPLAILRPTLVYGAADPHDGYGPNRFRRAAARGDDITLFGEGEERRDHVYCDDVAEIITRVLWRRSTGSLNIATGTVTSFRTVADLAVRLSGRNVAVLGSPRVGPMPHNGYRPFDIAACRAAFPDFSYRSLKAGMAAARDAERRKIAGFDG